MENEKKVNYSSKEELIITGIVFGGLYFFGSTFSLIVVSCTLLFFILSEFNPSNEIRDRRTKMWGETNLLLIIWKQITLQKPLTEKDNKLSKRIITSLFIISLLGGIVWVYYSYFFIT